MTRYVLGALLLCCSLLARAQESAPLFSASLSDRNNRVVALADFRGKPLIVNFWARWCLPCRDEIPELRAIDRAGRIIMLKLGKISRAELDAAVAAVLR